MRRALTLAAELRELSRMNAWLAAELAGSGLADAVVADLRLCLNEMVANTISYGYPGAAAAGGRIDIALTLPGDGTARVEIADDAAPFDPLAAPVAVAMAGIETARVGGFGIKLFRESSTDATYARRDGRNMLSFVCAPPPDGTGGQPAAPA